MLEAALAYAAEGIPVFPLAARTKYPIFPGGFDHATTDEAKIREWWERHPDRNIGAVPGRCGCLVPDIDTREAREAWEEIAGGINTAAVLTGGGEGVHPWYRVGPELAGRTHWRLDEGGGPLKDRRLGTLLFRASGGYVVVPPSIHPATGRAYLLEDPEQPIVELPAGLEAALLTIPARNAGGGREVNSKEARAWFDENSRPMSEGGRAILRSVIERILDSPHNARNDTLMAQVGVLCNAAYLWPIDLDEAREEIRSVYVDHVSDTRRAYQANREVDHAFDYIATQRYWEGPPDEHTSGMPTSVSLKPKLQFEAPKTPEDRKAARVAMVAEGALDLAALLRGEIPDTRWVVRGVIPQGRLTALVAEAKVGKSLFLLDMAASLATGGPFLGEGQPPMRVLYIDYEMTPDDVAARLDAMGYADDPVSPLLLASNLRYLQQPPMDPLDTEEGGSVLLELAEQMSADVVIVDTLAAAVAGAENDSDTYRMARMYTWGPLKAAGISVVRVDHLGKNSTRGARGSSFKRDDVDIEWEMTGMGGDRLLLKRTRSRLPGVEEKIEVHRIGSPSLRHIRAGMQSWPIGAVALAREAIKHGLDPANYPSVRAWEDACRAAQIRFDKSHSAPARAYIAAGLPAVDHEMRAPVQDPRAIPPANGPFGRDFSEPEDSE